MKAEEWLEGYELRDATTNGEDLAADIIRALKQENAELRSLITELKAVEDLYDTAETGPEYNYAYQRWQDAVKALFAKVCNGRP